MNGKKMKIISKLKSSIPWKENFHIFILFTIFFSFLEEENWNLLKLNGIIAVAYKEGYQEGHE